MISMATPCLRGTAPLDHRGFFLRSDGTKGSFAKLVEAVRTARIEGIEPLEMIVHDMTAPVESKPAVRIEFTNVLNRPISGTLKAKLGGLRIEAPGRLAFRPHETKTVPLKVTGGKPAANNTYPLSLVFDAGPDGRAVHYEEVHANVIARRTIAVDGKLDDWKGVLPQTVKTDEKAALTVTEAAWFPFEKFPESLDKGFATGYLAYDDNYFYFAAKIADSTPDSGTVRFETRDDDQYFYPEVCYEVDMRKSAMKVEVTRKPSENDLQRPDGDGRSGVHWENDKLVRAFAIDLDLPTDRLTRVALYFPPCNMHPNGFTIRIYDRQNDRQLDLQRVRKLWDGVYAVYDLAGKVRIRIGDVGWWYRARLGGFFFDPSPAGDAVKGNAYVKFVKFDWDTHGNWKGSYGADGYHVFCSPARYPAYVQVSIPEVFLKKELHWPKGVRRYSYRKHPDLPAGYAQGRLTDNVQIAFNAIPMGEDGRAPNPPGTMPRFTGYDCTDYEYALNKVAPEFGGGVEIWRLQVPGMPRKHFYPRQPKSPYDGPVKNGKLVTVHDGNTRIVEAALPWSEIPHVHELMKAGKPVKFSFRVNDQAGRGCLELARERSVSKRNSHAFHVDWTEHWANEVEFGFER